MRIDVNEPVIIYPQEEGGVKIALDDYMRLAPGSYLNDSIIDFYFKYIYFELMNEEQRKTSFFFSTYFFYNFCSNDQTETAATRHAKVARWTKKVNIFDKDSVFVPINVKRHWFLAVICFPGLLKPLTNNDRQEQVKA